MEEVIENGLLIEQNRKRNLLDTKRNYRGTGNADSSQDGTGTRAGANRKCRVGCPPIMSQMASFNTMSDLIR